VATAIRALLFILAVTTASRHAFAQQFACYTVQPGDTAAVFARRLTGSPEGRHEPSFRIINPTTSRVVPKSEYGHILPGWSVCVDRAFDRTQAAQIEIPERRWPIELKLPWWAGPSLILLAALLAWFVALMHIARRRAVLAAMKPFGENFVREFERPLFRHAPRLVEGPDAVRPVRSHLRFAPHRERLDILLAPHDGRTYPNLSDHRRNLEYDIDRVLQLMQDEPFVTGQLHAEGRWVVIPFHLNDGSPRIRKQEGVR
jgi:hypothetical protein